MAHLVKVSDYVANFFLAKGINTCFSVTGGGAMHLNDSFGHHPGYCTTYNHHEQASAMAAEGYTRVANKPAIVCVTSGPGATNAITGVLGAWLDSIPMIVLSGQMKVETTLYSVPFELRQIGFQEFNIVDSVSALTKYAVMVTDAKHVRYHLERAFYEAMHGRKGPVWLDIPLDIQGAKIDPESQIRFDFVSGMSECVHESKVRTSLIDGVLKRINQAKRPVLMVGGGVQHDAARNVLHQTIRTLRIPVVTEWNSEDLIDSDDPFYCGRPGTIGDRAGNFVVQNADLLLIIGCQLSIRQVSYTWDQFGPTAYKIGVHIDANELAKPTVKLDEPIHCSAGEFLAAVNASQTESTHTEDSAWYHWCKAVQAKYPVVLPEHLSEPGPMNVYAFFLNSLTQCQRVQPWYSEMVLHVCAVYKPCKSGRTPAFLRMRAHQAWGME